MIGQRKANCVYTFGIDPIWFISSNDLVFLNSFKMKFAVIVGILQMLLGIFMKGLNATF
jgi:V-type H+-transporting ATPase subunit a